MYVNPAMYMWWCLALAREARRAVSNTSACKHTPLSSMRPLQHARCTRRARARARYNQKGPLTHEPDLSCCGLATWLLLCCGTRGVGPHDPVFAMDSCPSRASASLTSCTHAGKHGDACSNCKPARLLFRVQGRYGTSTALLIIRQECQVHWLVPVQGAVPGCVHAWGPPRCMAGLLFAPCVWVMPACYRRCMLTSAVRHTPPGMPSQLSARAAA